MTLNSKTSNKRIIRRAYTLMELVVGLASSTFLMSGLAGALYISSHALDATTESDSTTQANEILDDLMADVNHAERFIELTATSMSFEVPDRDDDGEPEQILYQWSGVIGDPLYYRYNNGSQKIVVDNVQHLNFTSLTRDFTTTVEEEPAAVGVQFIDYTQQISVSDNVSITVETPPSTSAGDLLIAVVATDGDTSGSLTSMSGSWDSLLIAADDSGQATLGVWWKLAYSIEQPGYVFGWSDVEYAYAAIMHFSGQNTNSPIEAMSAFQGFGIGATSASVSASIDNSMILRIGVFDDASVVQGNAGMLDHSTAFSESSGNGGGSVSAAAAYMTQASAGNSGIADFTLDREEEYRTLTIAITPEEE